MSRTVARLVSGTPSHAARGTKHSRRISGKKNVKNALVETCSNELFHNHKHKHKRTPAIMVGEGSLACHVTGIRRITTPLMPSLLGRWVLVLRAGVSNQNLPKQSAPSQRSPEPMANSVISWASRSAKTFLPLLADSTCEMRDDIYCVTSVRGSGS